jgi:hypothetical protein
MPYKVTCTHDPVMDPNTQRQISPYMDYGRGLDGLVICRTCGQIITGPKGTGPGA